jgi:regulatory protein
VAAPTPKSKSSASDAATAAWEWAVRLLAARDRSEQEIRRALAARTIRPRIIDATVRRLRLRRYLDDQRFATMTAERAARRGVGSDRVRAELEAKGVAEALADAAVSTAFDDETALARASLARRFGDAPLPPATRAKAARFLLGRGFPEGIVLAILEEGC